MEEKTFGNEAGVSVSNARFIAAGQTYAMSGVTSVKSSRADPSRKGPIIMGIIGVLALMGGGTAMIVGLILIAAAAALWFTQKPEFQVLLSSASGEAKALSSKDGEFISRPCKISLSASRLTRRQTTPAAAWQCWGSGRS